MEKKTSYLLALIVGIAFPVLQVLIYFLRFGTFNTESPITDYVAFFVGGFFIGVALVYFLRRSESKSATTGTWVGFGIGVPFGAIGMMLGGLAGPVGAVLLGISPSIFMIIIGFFLGRWAGKDE